jgi:Glycosyl transferase family 2
MPTAKAFGDKMDAQQISLMSDALASAELPISIVIPVFNEQAVLEANAKALASYFDGAFGSGNWMFVFVDNGSSDATPTLLRSFIGLWPLTRVITLPKPNYGAALKAGLRATTTKWVYMLDIEQWDPPFMSWAWRARNHHVLFVGSKRADPTLNFRQPYRRLLSAGLNVVLQILFRYTGTDTHGQKLINRASLGPTIAKCGLDRGMFDTELVLRTIRGGEPVVEAPIVCRESRPHRNAMVSKIAWNLFALYRLLRVMRDVPFEGAMRYRRVSREDLLAEHNTHSAALFEDEHA